MPIPALSRTVTPLEAAVQLLKHVCFAADRLAGELELDTETITGLATSIDVARRRDHPELVAELSDLVKAESADLKAFVRELHALATADDLLRDFLGELPDVPPLGYERRAGRDGRAPNGGDAA